MDGQNGDYRPRTAGERSGAPGPGVRDWQKNTWFGPAPLNSNPFDEPEDAPELPIVFQNLWLISRFMKAMSLNLLTKPRASL